MSFGTLYAYAGGGYGNHVLATAAYAGVEISSAEGYEHGTTNKTPEYLAKFPGGKIPAFEGKDGFLLTETVAIAKYIARSGMNPGQLLGNSLEEEVKIEQWVAYAADINSFVGGHNYGKPYFEPLGALYREQIAKSLKVLEAHLATRTFLVTERITYADLTVTSALSGVFSSIVDKAGRENYTNVVRFYNTVSNHPSLVKYLGETKWLEKYVKPTGK